MATQAARKTSRERMPHPQTRSALLRNFRAAASSRNPMTTLTALSQPPLLGRALRPWGKRARKKKGSAKAAEKASMPRIGHVQAP